MQSLIIEKIQEKQKTINSDFIEEMLFYCCSHPVQNIQTDYQNILRLYKGFKVMAFEAHDFSLEKPTLEVYKVLENSSGKYGFDSVFDKSNVCLFVCFYNMSTFVGLFYAQVR